MMRRIPFLLTIVASLLFALIGDNEISGQGADELFTEAPEKVICSGRVLDEAGRSIDGASVSLIAPHGVVYRIAGRISNKPATISAATDADGVFTLEFHSDDERFFGTGKLIMMVQAHGFATDAKEASMDRLLVDLPLEVKLTSCHPTQLRIQDAAGKPAAGVHVRMARLNKVLLPFHLANNPSVETDAGGIAILPDCDKISLRSIYVESETAGSQLLPVQGDNDGPFAALMPTLQVNGHIVLPDGAEPMSFESRSALVGSMQSQSFSVDGPASFSWQFVSLDEQGKFLSSEIAAGKLSFQFVDDQTTVCQSSADRYKKTELTASNSPLDWKLTFKPTREIIFKIVGEDGKPIPDLWLADNCAGVLNPAGTRTNEQGEVSLFFPENEKPGGQLFPLDAFGRTALEPFGIILNRHQYEDDGSPKPIRLGRSRVVGGRVIDENSNLVVGATVEYSRPEFAQWAVKAAEVLDDSTTRLGVCLYAARSLPLGEERERMILLAIQAWEFANVSEWYHWSDPAKVALEQLAYFDTIQAHELDRLIFACFSRAPESFESMNLRGILGDAARLLSIRDAKLGRSLLEPNFGDSVWLFDHVGRTWFDRNIALQSTVWVDPTWAADVAQRLSDRYSPDDPVRQLQLFGSVILEMRTLVGVESQ